MGGKAPNFIPSNRPESGGTDKDGKREKSGLLEREKNDFAAADQEKQNTKHDRAHEAKDTRETDEDARKD